MMKAALWVAIGIAVALFWTSSAGEKFINDVSETYCSNYYDIEILQMPDKKVDK